MRARLKQYVLPIAIYATTRALALIFVLAAAPGRVVNLDTLPGYHSATAASLPLDYATAMTSWDGQWYWDIAQNGYPHSALGPEGLPTQTSLAFFPLYPLLVRCVMAMTTTEFGTAAPATSLVIGAAAVLVMFKLVERCADRRRALVAVALVCTFVSAPVLQAAYTESLALLLLASALLLLCKRQYLWCIAPVLLLGLTRNITLALAPVVLLHWIWRTRETRMQHTARLDPAVSVPHFRIATLLVSTLGAAALWPLIAALLTGQPDAYLSTVKAWPGFSGSILRPPSAALFASRGAMLALLCLVAVGLFALSQLPGRRQGGPELTGWGIAYPLYIFAVSSGTFSILRYLLLAFPLTLLWAPDAPSQTQIRRQNAAVAVLIVLGLVGQWFWVSKLLIFSGPSGGWGFP